MRYNVIKYTLNNSALNNAFIAVYERDDIIGYIWYAANKSIFD